MSRPLSAVLPTVAPFRRMWNLSEPGEPVFPKFSSWDAAEGKEARANSPMLGADGMFFPLSLFSLRKSFFLVFYWRTKTPSESSTICLPLAGHRLKGSVTRD